MRRQPTVFDEFLASLSLQNILTPATLVIGKVSGCWGLALAYQCWDGRQFQRSRYRATRPETELGVNKAFISLFLKKSI
jgi:hypothetical protein